MPHADASLVPPQITSKAKFWIHIHEQLQNLLVDQRNWVTNLANSASLIYNALLAFQPHFGSGDRAVNWCGEQYISLAAGPACVLIHPPHQLMPKTHVHMLRSPLSDIIIAGFYLTSSLFPEPCYVGAGDQYAVAAHEHALLLGPFCGKPACQFINVSPGSARGVCAAAFVHQKTILAPNVDEYPGHIACDGETKSEIVCPLILRNGNDQLVLGVLDLDCLILDGFDEEDERGLEAIADLIVRSCDW